MSATKRADQILKLHKVLSKHYKSVKAADRPVLEQILYAHCLEDTRPDVADECFARLQESFFDWNEVRVTTVRELSEVLRGVQDPTKASTQLKQTLHSVFEAIYSYDLEPMRKQNLGAAVKQLEGYRGVTPFALAYAVQTSLGGHSIPVSETALGLLWMLGIVSDKEKDEHTVPGLERAIAKTKGPEFGSLLNQLAADFAASPNSQSVKAILLEVDPAAKDRFPKRGTGRKSDAAEAETAADRDPSATVEKKSGKPRKATAKPDKTEAAEQAEKSEKSSKSGSDEKLAKSGAKKKAPKKKDAEEKPPKKKTAGKKPSKPIAKKASQTAKKSTSKQLARRKPR